MKKKVFKVGDKVFDIHYGWGVIIEVNSDYTYPISVEFDDDNFESYTYDGRSCEDENPFLSFTEYKLEGFSQERPEELPKKGQIVWVRDEPEEEWRLAHFLGKKGKFYKASIYFLDQTPPSWTFITTENPYKDV